ncbi:uncharacterized protein LOC143202514 isoform X2 [Rhynchophorus ferrugineus]|uniref:uncharacterized protein LOC143202514 isoform X2 n=1 Tax=Rhynchophorus ferrugineus TaxID=354439 RepID=UPI003FCD5E83
MFALLFLLGFLSVLAQSNGNEYILIDRLRLDFLDLENEMWKHVLWDTTQFDSSASEIYLVDHLTEFDKALRQMSDDIVEPMTPARSTIWLLELYPELRHIDNLYEKFRQYLRDQKEVITVSKKSIDDSIDADEMIRDIRNVQLGANATANKVYAITRNLFQILLEMELMSYYSKEYFQSPQQMYYNIYNVLALRDLKTYIMIEYTYLIDQVLNNGKHNYQPLAIENRKRFEAHYNKTLSSVRSRMVYSSTKYWRTDPESHSKGTTYDEFTRLLQGHIQNEVDMNHQRSCRSTCADYSMAKSYGCYDSDSPYCKLEKCGGRLIGCRFIKSDMDICPARTKSRRYEFIRYENGRLFGKNNNCWKKTVESWHRWFVHCSYCMCLCDDPNILSDRFINLRPVLSDVKANKIITGIKFVKAERVLHMQIQEGQLLPGGHVNQSTVQWVPLESYKITDVGVYKNKDFYQLSYEYRSMALDNVEAPEPNYVVTGVQFVVVNNVVRLSVRFNKMDWMNGIILKNITETITATTKNLDEVRFDENVDVPILRLKTNLVTQRFKFVRFTHTGFDADAAQTTIPYIDVQPVYNKPAVPLRAIEIGYKENNPSGGFITPVIFTYNYGTLLNAKFPSFDTRPDTLLQVVDN